MVIEVHGTGVEVDVGLSSYTIRMDTTFIGLTSRKYAKNITLGLMLKRIWCLNVLWSKVSMCVYFFYFFFVLFHVLSESRYVLFYYC